MYCIVLFFAATPQSTVAQGCFQYYAQQVENTAQDIVLGMREDLRNSKESGNFTRRFSPSTIEAIVRRKKNRMMMELIRSVESGKTQNIYYFQAYNSINIKRRAKTLYGLSDRDFSSRVKQANQDEALCRDPISGKLTSLSLDEALEFLCRE